MKPAKTPSARHCLEIPIRRGICPWIATDPFSKSNTWGQLYSTLQVRVRFGALKRTSINRKIHIRGKGEASKFEDFSTIPPFFETVEELSSCLVLRAGRGRCLEHKPQLLACDMQQIRSLRLTLNRFCNKPWGSASWRLKEPTAFPFKFQTSRLCQSKSPLRWS